MKIYVASSWRNIHQPDVVIALRAAGHDVYDFREPTGPGSEGFRWLDVGKEIGNPDWKTWTVDEYLKALEHPIAKQGFKNDFDALSDCDTCVFVAPAGVSAALEFGFVCGVPWKRTILYLPDMLREPDLMFSMADYIVTTEKDLLALLPGPKNPL